MTHSIALQKTNDGSCVFQEGDGAIGPGHHPIGTDPFKPMFRKRWANGIIIINIDMFDRIEMLRQRPCMHA